MYSKYAYGVPDASNSVYNFILTHDNSDAGLELRNDTTKTEVGNKGLRINHSLTNNSTIDLRSSTGAVNSFSFRLQDDASPSSFSDMMILTDDNKSSSSAYGMKVGGRVKASQYFIGENDTRTPSTPGLYIGQDTNSGAYFNMNYGSGEGGFKFSTYDSTGNTKTSNLELDRFGYAKMPYYSATNNALDTESSSAFATFDSTGKLIRDYQQNARLRSSETRAGTLESTVLPSISNKVNEIISRMNAVAFFNSNIPNMVLGQTPVAYTPPAASTTLNMNVDLTTANDPSFQQSLINSTATTLDVNSSQVSIGSITTGTGASGGRFTVGSGVNIEIIIAPDPTGVKKVNPQVAAQKLAVQAQSTTSPFITTLKQARGGVNPVNTNFVPPTKVVTNITPAPTTPAPTTPAPTTPAPTTPAPTTPAPTTPAPTTPAPTTPAPTTPAPTTPAPTTPAPTTPAPTTPAPTTPAPTIIPSIYGSIPSNGLKFLMDANNLSSYNETTTLTNLVANGGTAVINGSFNTFNANSRKSIHLDNINTNSNLTLQSYTVQTISMWIYRSTANTTGFLVDGRTSTADSYIWHLGSYGAVWQDATIYINNIKSTINWTTSYPTEINETGKWHHITIVANIPHTGIYKLFSRYSNTEGLDMCVGMVAIYDRAITQEENTSLFNWYNTTYPTPVPTQPPNTINARYIKVKYGNSSSSMRYMAIAGIKVYTSSSSSNIVTTSMTTTASSTHVSGSYPSSAITDSDINTFWHPADETSPSVQLDLGTNTNIYMVVIAVRNLSNLYGRQKGMVIECINDSNQSIFTSGLAYGTSTSTTYSESPSSDGYAYYYYIPALSINPSGVNTEPSPSASVLPIPTLPPAPTSSPTLPHIYTNTEFMLMGDDLGQPWWWGGGSIDGWATADVCRTNAASYGAKVAVYSGPGGRCNWYNDPLNPGNKSGGWGPALTKRAVPTGQTAWQVIEINTTLPIS